MLRPPRGRARQRQILLGCGCLLAAAGAAALIFGRRLPLPLRIEAGLGDLFAGAALLLYWNQSRQA